MNHSYLRAVAGAALMGIASIASAGGYIGGSIAQTSVDICSDARALGATSCDDKDSGFKLFGGYDFTDNLAVEVTYSDLGEVTASALGLSISADATSLAVAGKATMPIGESAGLFAKIGLSRWDAGISATGLGSDDDSGTDLVYGVGAAYSFNDRFSVRGEWETVDADGTDIDLLSVGLVYSF